MAGQPGLLGLGKCASPGILGLVPVTQFRLNAPLGEFQFDGQRKPARPVRHYESLRQQADGGLVISLRVQEFGSTEQAMSKIVDVILRNR